MKKKCTELEEVIRHERRDLLVAIVEHQEYMSRAQYREVTQKEAHDDFLQTKFNAWTIRWRAIEFPRYCVTRCQNKCEDYKQ